MNKNDPFIDLFHMAGVEKKVYGFTLWLIQLFIIILFRIISAQLPWFYLGVMWEIREHRFMKGTPTY